jgi:hypothetical protein
MASSSAFYTRTFATSLDRFRWPRTARPACHMCRWLYFQVSGDVFFICCTPLKVWIFIIVIAIHPPLMPSSSCTRTCLHDSTATRLRVSLGEHGEDTTTHCLHNAATPTACKEEWITASHLWCSSSMAWCLSHAALRATSRLLSSRPSCRHHGC